MAVSSRVRRRSIGSWIALVVVAGLAACASGEGQPPASDRTTTPAAPALSLPAASIPAQVRLEQALEQRRSTRQFAPRALDRQSLATLLWAGYGRRSDGGRLVPSAGGLYPLTLYALAGAVDGVPTGLYGYDPSAHAIALHRDGDLRDALRKASLDQDPITAAPVVIVVAGAPDRLRHRYAARSERFAMLEAGHVGANLGLVAAGLGLGAVTIGAFEDDAVTRTLGLPAQESAYYLIAVGHPARDAS